MTQRLLALDGARGFTVLFIPAIHTVMVFSDPYVHTTWFGYLLTFIAEGPGAQIFMTMMGIVFTFKKEYSTKQILTRAGLLLGAGYLLNALKFIVPYVLGVLPVEVENELALTPGNEIIQLLLMGDILHFASIGLVIIHFIYRLKDYWFWSMILAIILIFFAPFVFDVSDHYLIQLFIGRPPQIFFPVLSWIIYPLIGLTIGYCFQRRPFELFTKLLYTGIGILLIGVALTYFTGQVSPVGFYRTYPGETLIHISIVLFSLWCWNWSTPKIQHTSFFYLISWCSRNITFIYFVQWIFICWILPFIGYQTMNLNQSIMTAIWISTVVLGGIYLFTERKQLS